MTMKAEGCVKPALDRFYRGREREGVLGKPDSDRLALRAARSFRNKNLASK
jgi:hypothetical protein